MTYDKALTALADPTRRAILEALREGPSSVTGLAAALPVSRPAVSQHLKVLSDAGLVSSKAQGTARHYRLEQRGLADLRAYLDAMWDDALTAFAREAAKHAKGNLP
ncbi:MAG: metalloregulator ArsR/SmtB family transcription factor [Pseudomonadota bacterium]